MKVTLDTNALDKFDFIKNAKEVGVELRVSTVSERERWGSNAEIMSDFGSISEPFVLDESPLGVGGLGTPTDSETLEELLNIISNG